jgi:hypothetical protein
MLLRIQQPLQQNIELAKEQLGMLKAGNQSVGPQIDDLQAQMDEIGSILLTVVNTVQSQIERSISWVQHMIRMKRTTQAALAKLRMQSDEDSVTDDFLGRSVLIVPAGGSVTLDLASYDPSVTISVDFSVVTQERCVATYWSEQRGEPDAMSYVSSVDGPDPGLRRWSDAFWTTLAKYGMHLPDEQVTERDIPSVEAVKSHDTSI